LYTHPLAHAATLERKAKGERDAAMMLLSLWKDAEWGIMYGYE
jgi:hypothetical protein